MSGVLKGAGSAVEAVAQMQQANMESSQAKVTAQSYETTAILKEKEMQGIQKASDYAEAKIIKEKAKMVGAQKAAYAKSGVLFSEGSPLEVLADTATQYEMDISAQRYNTATTVAQKEFEVKHNRSLANYYSEVLAPAYIRAGHMKSQATLLKGAADAMPGFVKFFTGG